MRMIDADELKHDLEWLECDTPVYLDVMSTIDERTTVDAEPVRHGRWFTTESHFYCGEVLCSACRTEYDYDFLIMVGEKENQMCGQQPLPNYCPHCGAKMGERREDADSQH